MEIRSSLLHPWNPNQRKRPPPGSFCSITTKIYSLYEEEEEGVQGFSIGRHAVNKSEKSHTVIVISAIIFITITVITITVFPPHMYPIPRIISSLSVAPGGCVIVCWCAAAPAAAVGTVTPVDSQPDVFFSLSLSFSFFSPLLLGQRLCQVHRGNRGMVL